MGCPEAQAPKAIATSLAILAAGLGVWASLVAAANQQTPSPRRTQSLFGMATAPLNPVKVPARIRVLLPEKSVVYILAHTKMAPDGEDVVVYYPTRKNADDVQASSPEIAIVRGRELQQRFHYEEDPYWHDVIAAYATFRLTENRQAFGLCVTNSGDGHYSDFLILTWTPSGYESVFADFGNAQAQVRIREERNTKIELWSPDGYPSDASEGKRCIWCPQFYRITTYTWHNNTFVKAEKGRRTRQTLHPGSIAGRPFVFLNAKGPRVSQD